MGIETIGSQVIIIGAFIYFAVLLLGSFNDNWILIHDSLRNNQERFQESNQESFEIDTVSYDEYEITTRVTINNTGDDKIDLDYLDFFINGYRIPRKDSNRTIQVMGFSEYQNPGLWDPDEVLEANITLNLSSGTNYLELFSANANKDIITYEVI